MSTVTIHQFEVYDINIDNLMKSRRWGTREAIESIARGRILPETAAEVDEAAVKFDIPGFTMRNFQPNKNSGFPRVMR
jgi:hypothetical protein